MLDRKIINRISIIVIAALSLLSKMLESLAPLLSKVLVIASAVCLVAFTVWAIVMLIRFGAPEEQKANCPKWVINLFRAGALLIIIGAVLKVNLWPGGSVVLFVGMFVCGGTYAYSAFLSIRK